jgi:RING finger/CHY zinc finger protein 1
METLIDEAINNTSIIWCGHYKSGCSLIAKCCGEEFGCRFCHDNEDDTHTMNRYDVEEIVCNKCKLRQPVSNSCKNDNCDNKNIPFAKYYCDICHLYSDNHITEIYHCDKCKICRMCSLGNTKNDYTHCDKCGGCILAELISTHKCISDGMKGDCCICLESIFLSKDPVKIMGCGHTIHGKCFEDLLKSNKTLCPLCRKTILDGEALKSLIIRMDNIIESNPFRSSPSGILTKIKCNDCDFNDKVLYHPMGLKCGGCGGYNTMVDIDHDN